jgi:nucleoside-diphosphate-sugar epimerase
MTSNAPKKVLITGASGFVGGRLCEVMALSGGTASRAFVHSTASAARITRFPLDFFLGDICDRGSVDRAMKGCDAVVHLVRGDKKAMEQGLENVLQAASTHGVSRFVHVSSVAVYGNDPPPQSVSEDAPASRSDMEYGNIKLAQERRVLKHSKRSSLPVVILRPPNIYGPYAGFTIDLLNKIRDGRMAILGDGQNPCNLVYVDNLVEAIFLALWKPEAVGEIFFTTDTSFPTWEECLLAHASLLGIALPRISSADLVRPSRSNVLRDSLRALPRVMLSGELRSVLRQVPLIRSVESFLYTGFQSINPEVQQRIRYRISGPRVIPKIGCPDERRFVLENIFAAQARTVAHSSEKARRLLGYSAPISFQEGMRLTENWLRYVGLISRKEAKLN